jgi:hypothetical protein
MHLNAMKSNMNYKIIKNATHSDTLINFVLKITIRSTFNSNLFQI